HIALSGIMALFPFLIFCTSLAAFFNLGGFPDMVIHLIFDNMPEAVAKPLSEQVRVVLTQPRGDVLTFGAVLAIFFSSNGVEALRLGLNRAYRLQEERNFLLMRLQSIIFVVLSAAMLATIVFLLLLLPLAVEIATLYLPWVGDYAEVIQFWRLTISFAVLLIALLASHKWLPAGHRTLGQILPGICFTLLVWFLASIAFSMYLRSFANYVSTYAGLAGIMVALIFFYMISVIFLLGAEINAALVSNGSSSKGKADAIQN
ncbi:MAG: YihY/virulence factor BrkB family protein, partial [Rhizobiaceae bacterium]